MSTSNSKSGVGGTAQDGGMSTAATVSDGGPSEQKFDGEYLPPPGSENSAKAVTRSDTEARTSNSASGVGGTAQDGGLSTAATVADGGPDSKAKDLDYKLPA